MCESVAEFQGRAVRGPRRSVPARRAAAGRQRPRLLRALRQQRRSGAGDHDLRARHDRDAVEATRDGAFDFLEKPLARDRVLLVVKNALERSDLQRENQRFRELVGDAPRMIGKSAAFRRAVTRRRRWPGPTPACC